MIRTRNHSKKKSHYWQRLKLLLILMAVCATPLLTKAQMELNQSAVSNGAGIVSGGNYAGYASVGQFGTYMFANGSYIATQGIILNEISSNVEFTFELSGNLTENDETKSGTLTLKSSAAFLVGEPLVSTMIYLILIETGEVYDSTLTDDNGYFQFLDVPYLDFYFVLDEPIIPLEPVVLNFVESTVFVKEVEINGEVGTEGLSAEVEITPQSTTAAKEETKSMYIDNDKDGYGYGFLKVNLNENASELGYSFNNEDCDDDDPKIYPTAEDIPGSGIDANCDGIYLWYLDEDEDGLGTSEIVESLNSEPGEKEANNNYETNTNVEVCDPIVLTLDNTGNAEILVDQISISNEEDVEYFTNPESFDCSDIDSKRKVSIVVKSPSGEQKFCVAEVTVNGEIPSVIITESELPQFCQGKFIQLIAEGVNAVSYTWSNGSESSIAEVSTNGLFDVTVTSVSGCTANSKYVVNGFETSELLSSYTIIATDEVHLHNSNIVASGGVGITKAGKKAKLHDASHVIDFVRASQIEITSGSTIGTSIYSASTVSVPDFIKNTKSTRHSKSVKVKRNKTETLKEEVYREIKIEEGASVLFNASDVYIEEMIVKKGASIEFTQCANLYIKKPLKFEDKCIFNSSGKKVVVYVDGKVEVNKGSEILANIHANNNEVRVRGDDKNLTVMTGMFIGKKIHGDKNILWNMNQICDPCENVEIQNQNEPFGKSAEIAANLPVLNGNIDVVVYPNPTTGRINLQLTNIKDNEFKVSVLNMIGQKIYEHNYLAQNHIEIDLTGKTPGIYFVKYIEGETILTKKIILKRK